MKDISITRRSFTHRSWVLAAWLPLVGALGGSLAACQAGAAEASVALPDPAIDTPLAKTPTPATAVFAGGCFWGVQAVFQHVKGVRNAVSGYAGGNAQNAHYEIVSTGTTGHAESVQVTYDSSKLTYGQLLKVYFSVAHDPTTLNRQGPDSGTQYRSDIFFANPEQQRVAQAYMAQLNAAHVFARPIVTQLTPLPAFYPAESYHQDYATLHPDNGYIAYNDLPKLTQLQLRFPSLYADKPVLTSEVASR
jgi:peptide-methionine (S)-S-oxide reductase